MNAREARTAFAMGRVTGEQLLDLLEKQEQINRRLAAELERLKQRLAQYEPQVQSETSPVQPPGTEGKYSLEAEEKRRRRRKKKKSPGRRKTELKFAEAERIENIPAEDVRPAEDQLVRERAVWRLENGRAVLVGYRVFRAPGGAEPPIPGVTRRCEYGIEILVVLAFLVYIIGIPIEKACQLLYFFCQLSLSKSQADALLRQLAQHWELEFDTLCDLLVESAVVYMDETGWKVGQEGCSLWTFASKFQRVFLFGCHKDSQTLDQILPPDEFKGVGVSDDAAVYRQRFTQAQKCWAHLLRKAIRLALLYPQNKTYQRFLDQLLELYRDAKRIAADGRLGPEGRKQRVSELDARLADICRPHFQPTPDMQPHQRDFVNLANELFERMMEGELFTFVTNPDVEPTNNLCERLQRSPAKDRDAGRTSKNTNGARRRSVIVSVFESLRASLPRFTLQSITDEVTRWMKEGISLFDRQWQEFIQRPCEVNLDTG